MRLARKRKSWLWPTLLHVSVRFLLALVGFNLARAVDLESASREDGWLLLISWIGLLMFLDYILDKHLPPDSRFGGDSS